MAARPATSIVVARKRTAAMMPAAAVNKTRSPSQRPLLVRMSVALSSPPVRAITPRVAVVEKWRRP
jgi:hypothetical protein